MTKLKRLQKELENNLKQQHELELLIEKEKEKEKNWMHANHPLEFDYNGGNMTVKCNYSNWEDIREEPFRYGEDILYLGILESDTDENAIALTLEQMEELNHYLAKVINYMKLEGK